MSTHIYLFFFSGIMLWLNIHFLTCTCLTILVTIYLFLHLFLFQFHVYNPTGHFISMHCDYKFPGNYKRRVEYLIFIVYNIMHTVFQVSFSSCTYISNWHDQSNTWHLKEMNAFTHKVIYTYIYPLLYPFQQVSHDNLFEVNLVTFTKWGYSTAHCW